MSVEQNIATANRILEVINTKNIALLDALVTPNGVDHAVPPGMPETVESSKKFLTMLTTAFPDLTITLDDVVAEGDYVVQRITSTGTMKGEMLGMPPSNKKATWAEVHMVRFVNGKIAEHWGNMDQLGMLQQLGFIPPAS